MIDVETEFQQAGARLRAALLDPEAVQEDLLGDILRTNRDTEYGKQFQFSSISKLQTYRERVPLVSHEDIKPYVDRMIEGERNVLVEGAATFFGQTSGTTGYPKHIPFNPRCRSEYVHMLGPIVAQLDRDFPGACRQTLLLTAPFEETRTKTNVPIGNASGFVRRALDEHPYFRFAPESVYECLDPDSRSYVLLLLALMRPMRCFAAMYPMLLVNLFRRATELAEPLADDLEQGRLEAGPSGIRVLAAACGARLRPMPEAARRVRAIVRVHGRFVPDEYWPNVDVFHVWKGGTAKYALPELQAIFPRAEIRSLSSGSTEAALMVPLERSWSGGVPALCSTVVEFLPADRPVHASEIVTLRDLQEGHGYRLVVTNQRGLYRHVMEDVFSIEGRVDGIPFLQLEHRIGIVSSVVGEKVTEQQVSHAIDQALATTRLEVSAFQVSPEKLEEEGRYQYVVLVEVNGEPSPESLRRFLTMFEADLKRSNAVYQLDRRDRSLSSPVLYRVRTGYFDARRQARSTARGRADIQSKLLALEPQLFVRDDGAIVDTIRLEPRGSDE